MSKETGGPAFPREDYQANGHERGFERLGQEGMSLRDYFAAKAMQGMVSAPIGKFNHVDSDMLVFDAYRMADAMLKTRNQ